MKTQAGGSGGRDEGAYPSDLSHYLISLGELLVTWLSPQGVGAALSRRLLASGSSWSLLRTIGRAFRPELVRTCMAWHGMAWCFFREMTRPDVATVCSVARRI